MRGGPINYTTREQPCAPDSVVALPQAHPPLRSPSLVPDTLPCHPHAAENMLFAAAFSIPRATRLDPTWLKPVPSGRMCEGDPAFGKIVYKPWATQSGSSKSFYERRLTPFAPLSLVQRALPGSDDKGLPRCFCGRHSTQNLFNLWCGQPLQATQSFRILPCGQPVHAVHVDFTLPCGHGLHCAHWNTIRP